MKNYMEFTHSVRRRILVCPDSFKGSISARDAANVIADTLSSCLGDRVEAVCLPIADGGEGTLDALVPDGRFRRTVTVTGPYGVPVAATYGWIKDTAVIEMAAAAGLTLTEERDRQVSRATTLGVGELIKDAIKQGFRDFLFTVGGSATNDGGSGMLHALGAVFTDRDGKEFLPTGGTLSRIHEIRLDQLDPVLSECHFLIATDVVNPLLGQNGATYIYARQKGVDDTELEQMERGMEHYAAVLSETTGKNVSDVPGSGAGGGIAVPLLALGKASVCSGIRAVLDTVRFSDLLDSADCVITGEGKLDRQSLFGKAISGIVESANGKQVPVYAIVGCFEGDRRDFQQLGICDIFALSDDAPSTEYSITHPQELLRIATEHFADRIKAGAL